MKMKCPLNELYDLSVIFGLQSDDLPDELLLLERQKMYRISRIFNRLQELNKWQDDEQLFIFCLEADQRFEVINDMVKRI